MKQTYSKFTVVLTILISFYLLPLNNNLRAQGSLPCACDALIDLTFIPLFLDPPPPNHMCFEVILKLTDCLPYKIVDFTTTWTTDNEPCINRAWDVWEKDPINPGYNHLGPIDPYLLSFPLSTGDKRVFDYKLCLIPLNDPLHPDPCLTYLTNITLQVHLHLKDNFGNDVYCYGSVHTYTLTSDGELIEIQTFNWIKLQPNPAADYIDLSLNNISDFNGELLYNYEIIDSKGYQVKKESNINSGDKFRINLNFLETGLYYLKIQQNNVFLKPVPFVIIK